MDRTFVRQRLGYVGSMPLDELRRAIEDVDIPVDGDALALRRSGCWIG